MKKKRSIGLTMNSWSKYVGWVSVCLFLKAGSILLAD